MSNLKNMRSDEDFNVEISKAKGAIVVDFYATWCQPCVMIAPHFASLASKHPHIPFLKVDIDKCSGTKIKYNISAMPTFVLICNNIVVDKFQGANPNNLKLIEEKLKKFDNNATEINVEGHTDLSNFIYKSNCECLNESDSNTLIKCLNNEGVLESDCDEQIILNIPFSQAVKLHSLILKGPKDRGPHLIKIFINQTHTLDFDEAIRSEPVQTLELTLQDLEGKPIPLKFVKFQNVQNVSLFIQSNQTDQETTIIQEIRFIGSPMSHTNMSEFKRV